MHRSIHRSIHALCIHSFIRPSTHYPFLYPSVRLCCSLLYNNPTPHLISSQRTTPQRLLYFSDCFLFFSLLFFSFLFFSFRFFSFLFVFFLFFSLLFFLPPPHGKHNPPCDFIRPSFIHCPRYLGSSIRSGCFARQPACRLLVRFGSDRIESSCIGLD